MNFTFEIDIKELTDDKITVSMDVSDMVAAAGRLAETQLQQSALSAVVTLSDDLHLVTTFSRETV